PAALAAATATNGVRVPGLVDAFRAAVGAPAADFVHWGATSQDIVDTALVLRLRAALSILARRLDAVLAGLAGLAGTHAETAMAARTYGQLATPTSFGAVAAGWGGPLLRLRARLGTLRPHLLAVSLGGAAGTLAAMGPQGPAVRAGLAAALGLADPGTSWHSARERVAELAGWLNGVAQALGRMGEDLILLAQTGIAEVRLDGAGGSSTMPHKQNPVAPSVLVALARLAVGLDAVVQGAALHRQQRDGGAWFAEWLSLPQLLLATGRALATAEALVPAVRPDPGRMAAGLDPDGLGLVHAEALGFALSATLPRAEAQARVRALCAEARATGTPLAALAARDHPGLAPPATALGTAPAEARAFAAAAAALQSPAR
ncbi:MAG: adenylosuccinate lyase family protein, partial [Rhodobacteraceae bacterium]|nr:adenylosuccinate lyase family protein [Paracoccaceae bacterium]